MGWGQPVVAGKRVHSSTHDNNGTSESKSGESEEMSEPPPYCSKRAREISPELERICNGTGAGVISEHSLLRDELAVNADCGKLKKKELIM